MAHVRLFEEFINEEVKSIQQKKEDLRDKIDDISQKSRSLNNKIKEIQAEADTPIEIIKAQIGRLQLQLLDLDKQRAIISGKVLDLNKKLELYKK